MKETVIERMARIDAPRRIADFNAKMQMPYDFKKKYAAIRAREFVRMCDERGLNYHVSVGGLDSITLLLFLRSLHIDAPGISVSYLEDTSIQRVHKALGVECLKPLVKETRPNGRPVYWTRDAVIREFGFPVLSKEIAGKIELLQHPTEKNKTVRHAIITGETGEYGGNRKESLMRMSQKWLDIFGGADAEGAALGYRAAPFPISAKCCYYLKERPCDIWAKEHNSVPYLGLMASEGGRRAKSLKLNGCNYFGESTIRSAPFAIFQRQDILQLALDLNVPVPEIYGTIECREDGTLYTTKAQRTGCSMCGFGVHMDKRPHKFDLLREQRPKEWERLMYHLVREDGNYGDCSPEGGETPDSGWYGWGRVLDYIGVGWENPPDTDCVGQRSLFEETEEL